MRNLSGLLLTTALAVLPAAAFAQAPAPTPAEQPRPGALYTYQEVMVPMRDGAKLQTVIMRPTWIRGPLPILLLRTPYGVPDKPYERTPDDLTALMSDGYILAEQNIRGRFKSDGDFSISEDFKVTPGQGTIETRDAYDTIDWLVKNVPENNGRVGMYGVSYSGYTAAATLLGPHPALKAISEQASPADEWMNDDDHRYGALRLSYDFEYAVYEEADKNANTHFQMDAYDSYDFYLNAGPLSTLNDRYVHGKIRAWNEAVEHPDYDEFWKSLAFADHITGSTVPNLNVAGFYDQEDPWGPWKIWREAAKNDPDRTNLMVAGPWFHGGWRRAVANKLGEMPLGQDTGQAYRQLIEAPYFAYYLHGKGQKPDWAAKTFQTGSNTWRQYASWPPAGARPTSLYFHADGTLSFDAPTPAEAKAHTDYVSDPSKPVPYRARPISPTYPAGDWRTWESDDQRFVDHRPDVLTYVSAPLDHDITVSGEVSAELFAATTGTDADMVVKLIDVFPEDAQGPAWNADAGPAPLQYARSQNGYQLPIAMEVRRGRYLKSFEHPTPLTPNKPTRWDVPLRDRDHVFRAGHRIMVQVQSTWFPLIDRNPQKFVPNIAKARAADFVKATQTVYAAPGLASRIVLPVVTPPAQ